MAKTFDLKDDSVVLVVGSGAGGGTLSNELVQRGLNVGCLEAGSARRPPAQIPTWQPRRLLGRWPLLRTGGPRGGGWSRSMHEPRTSWASPARATSRVCLGTTISR